MANDDTEVAQPRLAAMPHEERLGLAQKYHSIGLGLAVSGFGVLAGLAGGLWGSLGGGAIGVGIGAASGLWAASYLSFRKAADVKEKDRQLLEAQTFGGGAVDSPEKGSHESA